MAIYDGPIGDLTSVMRTNTGYNPNYVQLTDASGRVYEGNINDLSTMQTLISSPATFEPEVGMVGGDYMAPVSNISALQQALANYKGAITSQVGAVPSGGGGFGGFMNSLQDSVGGAISSGVDILNRNIGPLVPAAIQNAPVALAAVYGGPAAAAGVKGLISTASQMGKDEGNVDWGRVGTDAATAAAAAYAMGQVNDYLGAVSPELEGYDPAMDITKGNPEFMADITNAPTVDQIAPRPADYLQGATPYQISAEEYDQRFGTPEGIEQGGKGITFEELPSIQETGGVLTPYEWDQMFGAGEAFDWTSLLKQANSVTKMLFPQEQTIMDTTSAPMPVPLPPRDGGLNPKSSGVATELMGGRMSKGGPIPGASEVEVPYMPIDPTILKSMEDLRGPQYYSNF
jgi:hypothetical protein